MLYMFIGSSIFLEVHKNDAANGADVNFAKHGTFENHW